MVRPRRLHTFSSYRILCMCPTWWYRKKPHIVASTCTCIVNLVAHLILENGDLSKSRAFIVSPVTRATGEIEGQEQERRYAGMERIKDEKKNRVDVHCCHICGFTAEDVRSLSVHLGSAHPNTVQPHLSHRCTSSEEHVHRQGEEVMEERKPLSTCSSGERSLKTNRELDAAGEVRPVWMSLRLYSKELSPLLHSALCNLREHVNILNTACLIIPPLNFCSYKPPTHQ